MKLINSRFHAVLDYLTVVFLAASPSIFDMTGDLKTFTYALAGVHLLLTILTRYELGLVKLISFRVHGIIEFIVAIVLGVMGWYWKTVDSSLGCYYYFTLAVIILIVFLMTDFRSEKEVARSY